MFDLQRVGLLAMMTVRDIVEGVATFDELIPVRLEVPQSLDVGSLQRDEPAYQSGVKTDRAYATLVRPLRRAHRLGVDLVHKAD